MLFRSILLSIDIKIESVVSHLIWFIFGVLGYKEIRFWWRILTQSSPFPAWLTLSFPTLWAKLLWIQVWKLIFSSSLLVTRFADCSIFSSSDSFYWTLVEDEGSPYRADNTLRRIVRSIALVESLGVPVCRTCSLPLALDHRHLLSGLFYLRVWWLCVPKRFQE